MARFPMMFLLLLAGNVSSCSPPSPPIPLPQAEYRGKLVGEWRGIVGNMKETMTFNTDGTFIAHLRRVGFISNTLSQGVTGTIQGTWFINGKVISMNITKTENERLQNNTATSTIEAFEQKRLTIRDESGETSVFERM